LWLYAIHAELPYPNIDKAPLSLVRTNLPFNKNNYDDKASIDIAAKRRIIK